jgi:hypothetical protein
MMFFQKIKKLIYNEVETKFSALHALIGIVILMLTALKLINNFNSIVDITFDDEAQYLRYGLDMFEKIRTDWGPSYNLWYKFLSTFEKEPIALYYLNFKVLIILLPISIFLFLYSYRVSFFTSFWISFSFLISATNIVTYPRISHFVVSMFLWILIINKLFIKSSIKQYILISFAVFVGSYARPELMLAFLLFLFFTIYQTIHHKKLKEAALFSFPFIMVMLMFVFVFKFPADTFKGINRTYIAFCQHYVIKGIAAKELDNNIFYDWIAYCKSVFPNCKSFIDILQHYPLLVIKEVFENTKFFILFIFTTLTDLIYPYYLFQSKKIRLLSYFLILILLIIGVVLKRNRQQIKSIIVNNKLLLLITFIFLIPSLISCFVIFPRQHYVLLMLPMLSILVAILMDVVFNGNQIKMIYTLIIAVLFCVLSPNISNIYPKNSSPEFPSQIFKKVVNYLDTKKEKQHVIFSNILSLSILTKNNNFTDFGAEYDYKADMSFDKLIEKEKIDYILVTKVLLDDRRLKKDIAWTQLIEAPQNFGFKKQELFKNCHIYLLIKNE